jgi:hypothetical protein
MNSFRILIILAAACISTACVSEHPRSVINLTEDEQRRIQTEYEQAMSFKGAIGVIRETASVDKNSHEAAPTSSKAALSGLSIVVTEQAHDGAYVLRPDQLAKADANSTIIVQFDTRKAPKLLVQEGQKDTLATRWQRVTSILGMVEGLTKSRAALNSAKVNTSEEISDLKKRVLAEDDKVVALINNLEQLGIDQLTMRSIFSGKFDGPDKHKNPPEPYVNLARWLRSEIEILEGNSLNFLKGKENLRVTVQAMHEPLVGSTKYLHIEDYDSFSEGEYRPIDRYGLNLTKAEKQRIEFEYSQATMYKEAIEEIIEHRKTIQADIKALLSDFKSKINELKDSLDAEPQGIMAAIDQITKKLEAIIADSRSTPDQKVMATESVKILTDLTGDLKQIHSLIDRLQAISRFLRDPRNVDLDSLVNPGGFLETMKGLSDDFNTVLNLSPEWATKVPKLAQSLVAIGLGEVVGLQEFKQLTDQPMQVFLTNLSSDLPKTATVIAKAIETIPGHIRTSKSAETLAQTNQKTIPHALDNLVPARVELPRAGLTLGDHITLKVKLAPMKPDGTSLGPATESLNYKTEVVLTGLHRRIGADLIFARGFGSGDARKWQPNVAARGEWHYLIRDPDGNWQKLWNWLDPGLGLHAASLNQGPESVEIGFGGNLSLWNNFVSLGYGHNLSTHRQYVFIGLNLLNVLNTAKTALGDR